MALSRSFSSLNLVMPTLKPKLMGFVIRGKPIFLSITSFTVALSCAYSLAQKVTQGKTGKPQRFKTSLKIRNQKLTYKNKESYTSYRVSINGCINKIPVVLQRKKKTECKYRVNPLNTGFKIESLGLGDYYGFEVDGNHRFLLEDFTVQHNSGKTVLTSVILDYEIC